jgi:hypothetical protein
MFRLFGRLRDVRTDRIEIDVKVVIEFLRASSGTWKIGDTFLDDSILGDSTTNAYK